MHQLALIRWTGRSYGRSCDATLCLASGAGSDGGPCAWRGRARGEMRSCDGGGGDLDLRGTGRVVLGGLCHYGCVSLH